jgi:hypothetical protein
MLLHVIETAGPVHLPNGHSSGDRGGQQVGYAVAFVHDVGELGAVQPSGIVRLAP